MTDLPIPQIRTADLVLQALSLADASVLLRIYQTEGVLAYFPNPVPPPIEKIERFIANQQGHWLARGYGNWGVQPEGSTEIAGWAGLQFLPELDETEVGFLLDRPFWGKGFATQAAMASLRFGFEQIGLDHIIALVHPENLASRRVIEKCGLQPVDTLSIWGTTLMRFRIDRKQDL